MEPNLTSAFKDQLLTLCLNRPAKLNCINWDMLHALEIEIDRAEMSAAVRVLLIRGSGDRSFSTGADLKVFEQLDRAETAEWIRLGHRVFRRLESFPKPTVAVIQGHAYGGGLELALSCDFRLASGDARFCMPEVKLGWVPGWGGMERLVRLVGEARAKEIVFLSEVVSAEEAQRIGLVHRVVASNELEEQIGLLTEQLKRLDADAFRCAKSVLTGRLVKTAADFDMLATHLAKGKSAEEKK